METPVIDFEKELFIKKIARLLSGTRTGYIKALLEAMEKDYDEITDD